MIEHIALIPDGNRRWSKQHGMPTLEGHRRGAEVMHNVIDHLIGKVKYLTLWGFSTDNWKRTENEIQNIFKLLGLLVEKDTPWLNERGVRLRHIGRLHELPDHLQLTISHAIQLTKNNSEMTLNLAFNYTGQAEILDAIRGWLADKEAPPYLDKEEFSHYLYTDGMPDVNLVIRTAGEFRLSNFMLWQTAYSEFYFTDVLWPDFSKKELEKALEVYVERKRRFGGD